MKPEFIALKYMGVPTVVELKKNASSYGWKFRKYSKWKQVHVESGDAEKLHKMADSLINEGVVSGDCYGRVSEILLNVQRWRLDKTNLLIEPQRKDTWERMNVGIKVALQHPRSIVSYLYSKGLKTELDAVFACMLFLLPLFEELKRGTEVKLAKELLGSFKSLEDSADDLERGLSAFIHQLYFEQCSYPETKTSGFDLINIFLKDLTIGPFVCPKTLPYSGVNQKGEPDVIVEYSALVKERVVKTKFVKGKTIVVLNENHVGLQNMIQLPGNSAAELIFAAIGLTANDMSSKERVIGDFLALLGLNLTKLSTDDMFSGHEE